MIRLYWAFMIAPCHGLQPCHVSNRLSTLQIAGPFVALAYDFMWISYSGFITSSIWDPGPFVLPNMFTVARR